MKRFLSSFIVLIFAICQCFIILARTEVIKTYEGLCFVGDTETYTAYLTYEQKNSDANYNKLDEIIIPEEVYYNGDIYKVNKIGDYALSHIRATKVDLPSSIDIIGNESFAGAENLRSLSLPEGITEIGEYAFSGCKFTSIKFPDSVINIQEGACYNMQYLEEIIFGENLEFIGSNAFEKCSNILNIYCLSKTPPYLCYDSFPFIGLSKTYVYVPITWINNPLFQDSYWQSFPHVIAKDVIEIKPGNNGDSNDDKQDEDNKDSNNDDDEWNIELRPSYISLSPGYQMQLTPHVYKGGNKVTTGYSLEWNVYPDNIMSVSETGLATAIKEGVGLLVVSIKDTKTSYSAYVNVYKDGNDMSLNNPSSTWYRKRVKAGDLNYLIHGESKSAEVTYDLKASRENYSYLNGTLRIPEYITYEGNQYHVEYIGAGAFENMVTVDSIVLPQSIVGIKSSAFYTNRLKSVAVGDSCQYIDMGAFLQGPYIDKIKLGPSVRRIASTNFYPSKNVERVICEAIVPPVDLETIWLFSENTYEKAPLYVPAQALSDYKSNEVWGNFNNILPLERTLPDDIFIINFPESSVKPGYNIKLTSLIKPLGENYGNVIWNSNNEDVAIVTQDGELTAIKDGFVDISVVLQDFPEVHNSYRLKIESIQPQSFTITSAHQDPFFIGETLQLFANITPSDCDYKEVTWNSSDSTIATIDENGLVTALKAGEVIINASLKDLPEWSAYYAISVKIRPTGISLEGVPEKGVIPYQTFNVKIQTIPDNAYFPPVTVTSSNKEIVSIQNINSNGEVALYSYAPGEATITIEFENFSELNSSFDIKVLKTPVNVSIDNNPNHPIYVGSDMQLVANVYPLDCDFKDVIWESSDTSVATVDEDGLVSALKQGETTISVRLSEFPDINASCDITIANLPTGITIQNIPEKILLPEEVFEVYAFTLPENSYYPRFIWESSNPEVVSAYFTVNNAAQFKTGKSGGNSTIKVYIEGYPDIAASFEVNVLKTPESVVITNLPESNLHIGETWQLNALVLPEDCDSNNIIWESSDTSVATVDQTGLVSALKQGDVKISAILSEFPEIYANCSIKVAYRPTGINIQNIPERAFLPEEVFEVYAFTMPENTDYPQFIWESSNPEVVSVYNTFNNTAIFITGKSGGNATIKVYIEGYPDIIASFEVNVLKAPESVVITNLPESNLFIGDTWQLNALVLPEDCDFNNVIWVSSDEDIAIVDNGLVKAINPGNVIISVYIDGYEELYDSCVFNIENSENDIILEVRADNEGWYNVYTPSGLLLFKTKDSSRLLHLEKGIYIINGKKIFIN